ncbi:hypothetical protein [Thermomonospora catenispora]|uniref:hypothetical protein n=1 Tax=Thermomonospora catenispora TaxID=2493090 RepID=UPI001124A966|nr:hypothetical protein [Thermomonospora catenispora]TNY36974.1 hypothetical protein EIO00_10450 [Thermomonospora catenispora]
MATIEAHDERTARREGAGTVPRRELTYRFLAAVDIEGFSRLNAREQVAAQDRLYQALELAAGRSGLDRSLWQRESRGDSELAILPGDIDGPRLVADYPRHLAAALRQGNEESADGLRLRVRLALHHGAVVTGGFGAVGRAPIEVSRLVNLKPLRRELRRRRDEDLVLIVSTALHREVVESGFGGLDPADFEPVSEVVKGQIFYGHIYYGKRPRPVRSNPSAKRPWSSLLGRLRKAS